MTLRRSWRLLTSMRTALLLLLLLALAAVPGSVLPQRGLNPPAVERYFLDHPSLALWLDRFGLFDVYAAPFFIAIYLMLLISLVGCLVPRISLHARSIRARPPRAPMRLDRLGEHVTYPTTMPPEAVITRAAQVLRRRRWRVSVDGAAGTVSAEKGYARESGNLVFHVALLVLFVAVAWGGLFGYKGMALVVEGDTFTNTPVAYDQLQPGRLNRVSRLRPFSVTVDDFHATYLDNGQPLTFAAALRWRPDLDAPEHRVTIRVNEPLTIDGARVYLLSHGYALHLRVTQRDGTVVFDDWTPFLPADPSLLSTGVVKVPDTTGGLPQIGVRGIFLPTISTTPDGQVFSRFPAAQLPALTYETWAGDLGLGDGVPQNVYELDTTRMVATGQGVLFPGQSDATMPGGATLAFLGVRDYAVLQVTDDPGKVWALAAAVVGLLGLVATLRLRRRRFWLRAVAGDAGTLVSLGGLARQDPEAYAREFAALATALREG